MPTEAQINWAIRTLRKRAEEYDITFQFCDIKVSHYFL